MKKKYNSEKEQVDAAWNKLEPLLEDENPVFRKLGAPFFNQKIIAAAAVLIMATVFTFLFVRHNSDVVFQTRYGQTTRLVLPDSSVIFLNGNSRLSYAKNWPLTGAREVKIEGEAYFSIKHTKTDQRFFVRMKDGLSVEVLGTQFNVSNRQTETNVVLNSGKIRFHMEEEEDDQSKIVTMKPGELVAWKSQSKTYIKKAVDPELYSAWKSSRLVFEKTELKEVLRTLHDTYGLKVKVDHPELLHMRVSGSAPTQNIDLLINGLSEIFHLEFIKKGDTLIVTSK